MQVQILYLNNILPCIYILYIPYKQYLFVIGIVLGYLIKQEPEENQPKQRTLQDAIDDRCKSLPSMAGPKESKKKTSKRKNTALTPGDEQFVYGVSYPPTQNFGVRSFYDYDVHHYVSGDDLKPQFILSRLLDFLPPEMIGRIPVRETELTRKKKVREDHGRRYAPDLHPSLFYKLCVKDAVREQFIYRTDGPPPAVCVADSKSLDAWATELRAGVLSTWPFDHPKLAVDGMELALNQHTMLTVPFHQLTHSSSLASSTLHFVSALRYVFEAIACAAKLWKDGAIEMQECFDMVMAIICMGEELQEYLETFALEGVANAKYAVRSAVTRSCCAEFQRFVLAQPVLQGDDLFWKPGDPRLVATAKEKLRIFLGLDSFGSVTEVKSPKLVREVYPGTIDPEMARSAVRDRVQQCVKIKNPFLRNGKYMY